MRKYIRLLSGALAFVLFLFCLPISINGEEGDTPCEILEVSGGADGIVSMTFDDGYYSTAELLLEFFEKYDLYGTVMMSLKNLRNSDGEYVYVEKWQELLEGTTRLKVQNHSHSHINLGSNGDVANQTDEVFHREFIESRELLEEFFPGNDIITFATAYGTISDSALEYAKGEYFAIRTTTLGVQTLNPGFGDELGDWAQLYSPVVVPYSDGVDQWGWIKSCIDNASDGWYLPIIHRVGDVELTDLPYDVADKMFSYIASLRDEGRVWVTDFETATKYVRERQNSRASVRVVAGAPVVSVEMSEYTADNMYLDPEIFDTPLTVKVPLDDEYDVVYYTVDGVEYIANSFSEGGKTYAYINVKPNTELTLRDNFSHTMGEFEKCDDEHHKRVCTDCGYIVYYEHNFDEGRITLEPTHVTEGERTCICTVCDEDGVFVVDKKPAHTFDKEVKKGEYLKNYATCTLSREYYYSCECGLRGEETFFSGNPLGHNYGEWEIVSEPTDSSDGVKIRTCRCGDKEEEILPKLNQSAPNEQNPGDVENNGNIDAKFLPIIIGAGALLVIACAVVLFLIGRRKSGKTDKG